ncbi:MAG: response regulator [Deltaproteobacteria bacterium]|nr:response regulator [Deltaproteobacteria bacterium]
MSLASQWLVRILVVDDERGFGSLLGRTLRRLGHEAVLAYHPFDAIEMLDPSVDAVITDIDMPNMDGVQLAQQIRRRFSDMPIAFCTGSDPEDSVVRKASEIGRVFPKIWTLDEVMVTVEELRKQRIGNS